jgi:hypothetical protein
MPKFKIDTVDSRGVERRYSVAAVNEADALAKVKAKGLFTSSIEEVPEPPKPIDLGIDLQAKSPAITPPTVMIGERKKSTIRRAMPLLLALLVVAVGFAALHLIRAPMIDHLKAGLDAEQGGDFVLAEQEFRLLLKSDKSNAYLAMGFHGIRHPGL